jgi:hypothetical protein
MLLDLVWLMTREKVAIGGHRGHLMVTVGTLSRVMWMQNAAAAQYETRLEAHRER